MGFFQELAAGRCVDGGDLHARPSTGAPCSVQPREDVGLGVDEHLLHLRRKTDVAVRSLRTERREDARGSTERSAVEVRHLFDVCEGECDLAELARVSWSHSNRFNTVRDAVETT
jgi:hypothetical protein